MQPVLLPPNPYPHKTRPAPHPAGLFKLHAMAKVVFTAIVSEISGRLAGSVFQRSVGGYQLHTIGIPINRRTLPQQLNRVTLEFLSSNWQTLTEAQKLSYPGSTNQERFTSYIAYNFDYAWLSGSLIAEHTTPTPATMPEPSEEWYASKSGANLVIGAYYVAEITFANARQWYMRVSDPVPVGVPASSNFRQFIGVNELSGEGEQIALNQTFDFLNFTGSYAVGSAVDVEIVINKGTVRGTTGVMHFTVG